MAQKPQAPIIIIRRQEEEEDHPPHGGAWKVALADLMTAMMSFFLIMWLIASSDEAELTAMAEYFTPNNAREQQAGGAGILWGESPGTGGIQGEPSSEQVEGAEDRSEAEPVTQEGDSFSVSSGTQPPAAETPARFPDEGADPQQADALPPPETPAERVAEGALPEEAGPAPDPERQAELERILEAQAQREADLERVEAEIRNAVLANNPPDLLENLDFQITPEGLLVRILDRDRKPIFETGSAAFDERSRALVVAVAGAIYALPYPIVISGHTDAAPYRDGASYSNWELSTDRANSTRRLLIESGVGEDRISRVSGLADTVPLNPENTLAPENRRINLLLRFPDPLLGDTDPDADRP